MGHSKAVLRGKFIAVQSYLRKLEKSQINNLPLYQKQLEREQTKLKVSRTKEINKDQSINKWTRDEESNRKDQWNQMLVLWKDKQNW